MKIASLAALALLIALSPVAARDDDPPRKTVPEQLADLREEIASLRRLHGATNTELRLLTERLERIERSLERLAAIPSTGSTSRFTPAPVRPPSGQLRLDNRMAVTAYVTVDGITYSVPPLGSRLLRNQPVGTIGYSLGGDGLPTGP